MNRLRLLLIALGVCGAALAQETTLNFDPAQTHIEWTLDTVLHTVHGTFVLKRGMIHFDPASGKAGCELVINAASGESGSGARDRRMHKEILESQRYPDIVFAPDQVEGKIDLAGISHVKLHGQFTIHGGSHNPTTLFLKVGDTVRITINGVGKASD